MSLSFIENKDKGNESYIKLEIHECQICEYMNVPLPYGLLISFNNNSDKYIESIKSEKEILKPPKNTFMYNLDKNDFNNKNLEFIITSYTTSIFIIKKNFASVKIPLKINNINTKEKTWYFLKDKNNNICIKLLISIEINISKEKNKANKTNNILYKNNKTIDENKIKNINRANTNNIINSHNTYLISTNYNSSYGNSLLNLTNNINNNINSNNNNNINISFPINLSPIALIGKSNSFFIDSKNKQMENNMKIINNNLNYKNSFKAKKEKEKSNDSLLINDNEFKFVEDNNSNNNNNKIKYRQEIINEINNYEKLYLLSMNNIYNMNNNLEKILILKNKTKKESNKNLEIITPRKAESHNQINMFEHIKNKAKKGILCLNKIIPHNPMLIKKLNIPNKNGKINNYIKTGKKLHDKKCTPINYKYKQFNRKLSTSNSNVSNNENININENNNKILRTEGKVNNNNKRINTENINININKYIKIDKNNLKRKSLKINANLKIAYNEISSRKITESSTNNNNQSKYSFSKMNLSKESQAPKKNLTITNIIINNKKNSNNYINRSITTKSKTIEGDYIHNNSNISLDKNIFSIENIFKNNNRFGKTALNKNNNLGRKKLNPLDKTKIFSNKSLNIDNFKYFNSHNYFKGNPLFIKSNNNQKNLTIKNNTIRINTNPNETNKKRNIKYRNNLNLSGNILLLNAQNPNKSTRENKRKPSNRKILLNELFK